MARQTRAGVAIRSGGGLNVIKADVVVAGDLFVDLILSAFDSWPEPGRESFAQHFVREAGGGAAITAAGLAKCGLRTEVFGVVGASDSEWLLARLRETGAQTSAIRLHDTEPTAFTVVASTAQDRAFLTYQGANNGLQEALLEAAANGEFTGVRHVHLACAPKLSSAPDLLHNLHSCGCTVSLDVGWHPAWLSDPRSLSVLAQTDLFFPNEAEILHLTKSDDPEAAMNSLAKSGVRRIALKLGSKGAALRWDGESFQSSARNVLTVDVTGAGDCFDAGFLYGWLTGRTPQQCLDAANFCGAVSTEAHGGIAGFPDVARVRELWR